MQTTLFNVLVSLCNVERSSAVECMPNPAAWRDIENLSCDGWFDGKWCTANGQKGAAWDSCKWKNCESDTFADYAKNGYNPLHCPQCGCCKSS